MCELYLRLVPPSLIFLNGLHYLSLRLGPPQSMISIICLFGLVHLNGLLFDEWVDHVVKDVLKLSIFIVQKAAAPKNGVEFCQGSNGTIRSSLATSYKVWRRRATFDQSEA